MIDFLIKKLELFFITLFILTLILFWAHIRLGDVEINKIVPEYIHYAGNLVTLNFGNSTESGMPIIEEMKLFFPPTIELLLLSLAVSFCVGIFLGIVGGLNRFLSSRQLRTCILECPDIHSAVLHIHQDLSYHGKHLHAV